MQWQSLQLTHVVRLEVCNKDTWYDRTFAIRERFLQLLGRLEGVACTAISNGNAHPFCAGSRCKWAFSFYHQIIGLLCCRGCTLYVHVCTYLCMQLEALHLTLPCGNKCLRIDCISGQSVIWQHSQLHKYFSL